MEERDNSAILIMVDFIEMMDDTFLAILIYASKIIGRLSDRNFFTTLTNKPCQTSVGIIHIGGLFLQ